MKTHISPTVAAFIGAGMLSVSLSAQADNLLSLYRDAVQADAAYLAAQADARASREMKPQALARLLPNASFSGTRYKNSNDQTYTTGLGAGDTVNSRYSSYNYSVGVTQPLFRAAAFATWRQSRVLVEGAEAELQGAEQDVGTRLSAAYIDVLLAEANLEVTRAQRDSYLTHLDYAQKAFQTGRGTRTDIDEARSQLDLAAAQTIELQYQLNYAHDALRAIVDRPLTPLARLNPERMTLVRPDPDRIEDWIQKAEGVNPQLTALRASVEAASLQVKKALSGHLPTLDFVAQRIRNESNTTDSIDVKNDATVYGLRAEMPIFSGGETQSLVRQARAELDKARQQLEDGRRKIGLQIRKEFDGVAQGVHWVRAYEQAVKSAEQALESTRKGFMAGTRSTLDVLIAEQNLATARRDLNRARYQYMFSRLQLLALVGELKETEIARFNGWLDEPRQ
ncbi:MAG: TolC family outer membrane protein [Betaproteobacteria bacterium]|nr:TolC family outer membrane protein [Betaproteobacteria bacterium]